MAYENHNWAWRIVGLRGSHYVALHALVNEADGHGHIDRISLRLLARRCNVSYDTARRLTNDLQRWGLIRIEERFADGGTGKQISSGYWLERHRLFPKTSELNEAGEDIGAEIWTKTLEELTRIRGEVEVYLLRNQIREAYFDASQRETSTGLLHGVLYVIAETDTVRDVFRANVRYLKKLFAYVPPYLVDWVELVKRPEFEEEREEFSPSGQ